MSHKETMLADIRRALSDVPKSTPEEDVHVAWEYGRPLGTLDVLADFVEKVEDYKARVDRVRPDRVEETLAAALREQKSRDVVLPDGLDEGWARTIREAGVTVHLDEPRLTHEQLNSIDTVVTGCAVGMADSGTIALDHSEGQGRRALTLLPDIHVVLIHASQVVSDVPEGIARLAPAIRARRPITWLSGGSATSDIELERVEGVHGPRHLHVILIDEQA